MTLGRFFALTGVALVAFWALQRCDAALTLDSDCRFEGGRVIQHACNFAGERR